MSMRQRKRRHYRAHGWLSWYWRRIQFGSVTILGRDDGMEYSGTASAWKREWRRT